MQTARLNPKNYAGNRRDKKPKIFSIDDYLKQLFTANPGFYRDIVFVVTSEPFNQDTKQTITHEEAVVWLLKGDNKLPDSLTEKPYTEKHRCTALIYQFERTNSAEEKTVFVDASPVLGKDHLVRSGIFKGLN